MVPVAIRGESGSEVGLSIEKFAIVLYVDLKGPTVSVG